MGRLSLRGTVADWRTWLPYAWVAALALLVTAPTLTPGFTLSYDLVFTPRQDLLPASLGLGGGLPRAVPQDAVVAIVEYVVPGALLEKCVLLAIPLLAGCGMVRLLRGLGLAARLVAATLAVWSPYVAERLVLGHWGLLIAFALLPWAMSVAIDARRGTPGAAVRLVLLLGCAALTPTGCLLAGAVCIPIAVGPRTRLGWRGGSLVVAGGVASCLPWLVPALVSPVASASDPLGAEVFALRAEGWWGPVVTALGTGGVWNGQAVPVSRAWPLSLLLTLGILVLAAAGWRPACRVLGRAALSWLAVVSAAGLIVACWSSTAAEAGVFGQMWTSLVSAVPGGGLVRDAQKLLAPMTVLLAALAGAGVGRLAGKLRDAGVRRAAVAAAVMIPIALLPDMAWGVGGRLGTADYPADFPSVRGYLQIAEESSDGSGDVIVLPWAAFRRFDWNAGRTVLDPAPRWLPAAAIVDDGLPVMTPSGLVRIAGEDPRSSEVKAALTIGAPLADVAGRLGAAWVLVELGQAPPIPPHSLDGLVEAFRGSSLVLYRVPGPIAAAEAAGGSAVVIGIDIALALALSALAAIAAVRALRSTAPRRRGARAD